MNIFNTTKTRFVSHRGFRPLAPDNSLPAFRYAGLLGQWAIETDVRLTRDGRVVCCHNDSLEKYCNTDVKISEITYSDLLEYGILNGNRVECFRREERRIPLFSEYLDICRRYGCVPFIELKTDDAARVIHESRKHGFEDSEIIISSVLLSHLKDARRLAPDTFIHWIFAKEDKLGELSELGNAGLSWKIADPFSCEPEKVSVPHSMGLRLCLRAADDIAGLDRMHELGLDYFPTNCLHGDI